MSKSKQGGSGRAVALQYGPGSGAPVIVASGMGHLAERIVEVAVDSGVPVLSMHAPFETVGKLDCYMTYKGIKAFYEK